MPVTSKKANMVTNSFIKGSLYTGKYNNNCKHIPKKIAPYLAPPTGKTMIIRKTEIYKLSIPMHPFTIATGTMHFAQNTFIRVHTSEGLIGHGECSAFPMIAGETQNTCFEMAKDFATLWKGK